MGTAGNAKPLFFNPVFSALPAYLAAAALFAASIFLIRKADALKTPDWDESRLTYLPSGKLLRPMVMDLDEAAADLLWIKGMIYFADAYLEHKSYRWLSHILDIVTTLNPHFHQAYEFGGAVLTKQTSQLPQTLHLLDRGIAVFPQDWKLRLYAAMAQLKLDSNFVKAAEYLKPIALDKGVPDHIRTMSASLLSRGGGRSMALTFLVNRYIEAENIAQKTIHQEIFLEKILALYPVANLEGEDQRKAAAKKILDQTLVERFYEPVKGAAEDIAVKLLDAYLQGG